MAWTLCSKQDVIDMHPVALTELKDSWSDMVEGLIRQYMGMPYLGTTQAIVDEWHDGDGTNVLRVLYPPIVSVEALTVAGLLLSPEQYVVFPTMVELKARNFVRGPLTVKVSYTSGVTTIDETVRLAAGAMIVAVVNYRKRAGADSSLKWAAPADQKTIGEDTPNQQIGLTSHLTRIMKQILRRPRVRAY